MIKSYASLPAPIKSAVYTPIVIGVGCLIIGMAVGYALRDWVMYMLSSAILIFSVIKAANIFMIGIKKKYVKLKCICKDVEYRPFSKIKKVTLELPEHEQAEVVIRLNKSVGLKIGETYFMYFVNNSIGENIDIGFIGYEGAAGSMLL